MKYPAIVTKSYLFKLSIPIFFSNLAIPMVGVVDTWLMGHQGDASYLAAVSISTSVISMIFWSFGFLRMSTVGLVAQSYGKGDYREIVLIAIRNLVLASIIGFGIIFLQYPATALINQFFNPSIFTQGLINDYISIRIFSAPAELTIYVLVGLFIGLQRTIISSLLITFFCVINIFFSLLFVNSYKLGIDGVAFGTVLSAYLTVLLFLLFTYFFIRNKFSIIPRFRKVFLKRKILKLFNININIFIRTILLTFAFLLVTYHGATLGENYLAVNSILIQFIIVASFFLDAYAFSTEGIVGYAVGRKSKKSFLSIVSNSFEISIVTGLVISILYLAFFKFIINSLTDIEYIRFLSFSYVFWIVLIPPVASFCYQFDGIFIGASQTNEMRNAMISSVILFVALSFFLTEKLGNHGLWFSLLIFMILRSVTLNFYFYKILKKF